MKGCRVALDMCGLRAEAALPGWGCTTGCETPFATATCSHADPTIPVLWRCCESAVWGALMATVPRSMATRQAAAPTEGAASGYCRRVAACLPLKSTAVVECRLAPEMAAAAQTLTAHHAVCCPGGGGRWHAGGGMPPGRPSTGSGGGDSDGGRGSPLAGCGAGCGGGDWDCCENMS